MVVGGVLLIACALALAWPTLRVISGTRGTVGSGPLPVAPLHLGSPWRSAAERFRASSLGFGLARCCRGPSRTGRRAHRVGLAHRTRWFSSSGTWPRRHPRFPRSSCCSSAWRPRSDSRSSCPVLQYQQPRLPREASPTKVAKNEQHNNDDDDDPNPGHVILSLGACRLYGESAPSCNMRGLGHGLSGRAPAMAHELKGPRRGSQGDPRTTLTHAPAGLGYDDPGRAP